MKTYLFLLLAAVLAAIPMTGQSANGASVQARQVTIAIPVQFGVAEQLPKGDLEWNTTIAIILTIVVTNWTHIGDFRDNSGRLFDVQEGRMATNTVVDVLLDEIILPEESGVIRNRVFAATNRFVLKSIPGPVIAERKVILISNLYVTNIFHMNWITNKTVYPSHVQTTNIKVRIAGSKGWYSIPAIKLEDE